MATSSKITAPNPSIFTSDPLEQIFAKDMFTNDNNHRGGLAYMMLNAAESARDRNQAEYTGSVDKSNEAALMLSRMEEAFKHRQEMAKLSAQLIPHGVLASAMPGSRDYLPDPKAGDAAAQAMLNKINSETAAHNAAAANAGAGGATKVEFNSGMGEGGALLDQSKVSGKNWEEAYKINQELKRRAQINQMQNPGRASTTGTQDKAKQRYPQLGQ